MLEVLASLWAVPFYLYYLLTLRNRLAAPY